MKLKKIDINKLTITLFIIFISLFQVILLDGKKSDSDILWHYKLGEEIIKTNSISLNNTFSFLNGTEWIPQEWLYEVMVYTIISASGIFGFMGMCFINSVVMWILALRNKDEKMLFLLIATLVIYATPRNIANRPSEFSIYFLLIIIYLYNKDIKDVKKLLYFILGIIIANFHGGIIIVLTAVWFIMIANDLFNDFYSKTKVFFKYYINKTLELMIFMAGTLINPSGIRLISTIVKIHNLNTTQYIQEWQPTEVNYLLGIIIGTILISFGYNIGKYGIKRKDLQIILICSALLILSLHSMKAFILFDIVWIVYGYIYLEKMIYDILYDRIINFDKIIMLLKTLTPAVLTIFCITFIQMLNLGYNNFDKYVNSSKNEEIIQELKCNYTDNIRILTGYSNGNYLIYNDMKCFVDSRQWPYAKELGKCEALDELFYIASNYQDKEYIEEFINKYNFDYIWTDKSLKLDSYLENTKKYEIVINSKESKEKLWKKIEIYN